MKINRNQRTLQLVLGQEVNKDGTLYLGQMVEASGGGAGLVFDALAGTHGCCPYQGKITQTIIIVPTTSTASD